uniref:Uncharacterized protein n=1 Tax=Branchiostoma floridae TaxID=7739 RepID=C3Y0L3_BRAFL|eukprot:XP_002610276.1 hypothetical protein BRAFLDRAFT_93000 [Branchiostoma floridae]
MHAIYRNKTKHAGEDFGDSLMMASSFPSVLSPTGGEHDPTLPGDSPVIVIPKTADTVMKVRHQNDIHNRKRQEAVKSAQLQRDAVIKYLTTEQRRLQLRLAQLRSKTAAVTGYLSEARSPRTGRKALSHGHDLFISQPQRGRTAMSDRPVPSPPSTAPVRPVRDSARDSSRQRYSAGKENDPLTQEGALHSGTQYRDHYLVSTPPNVRRRIVGQTRYLVPPSPLAFTTSRSAEEVRTTKTPPGSPVLNGLQRADSSDEHLYDPASPKAFRLSPTGLTDAKKNSTTFPPIHAHKSGKKVSDVEAWRIHNLAREYLPQPEVTLSPPSQEKWAHTLASYQTNGAPDADAPAPADDDAVEAVSQGQRPPSMCFDLHFGSPWERPDSGRSCGSTLTANGSVYSEMNQDELLVLPRSRALAYLHPNTCVQMKPSEIVSKIEVKTGKTGIMAWLGEGSCGMGRAMRETALRKKQDHFKD